MSGRPETEDYWATASQLLKSILTEQDRTRAQFILSSIYLQHAFVKMGITSDDNNIFLELHYKNVLPLIGISRIVHDKNIGVAEARFSQQNPAVILLTLTVEKDRDKDKDKDKDAEKEKSKSVVGISRPHKDLFTHSTNNNIDNISLQKEDMAAAKRILLYMVNLGDAQPQLFWKIALTNGSDKSQFVMKALNVDSVDLNFIHQLVTDVTAVAKIELRTSAHGEQNFIMFAVNYHTGDCDRDRASPSLVSKFISFFK
jgi:hypothetical protein